MSEIFIYFKNIYLFINNKTQDNTLNSYKNLQCITSYTINIIIADHNKNQFNIKHPHFFNKYNDNVTISTQKIYLILSL